LSVTAGLKGEESMERVRAAERPRVLVVDDEEVTSMLAAASLERAGFAVERAADGAGALSLFDRLRPDLVLLDVVMPGMDGFAVCAAIRARREGGATPVIMMTVLEDEASIRRAYEIGATDFITKPVNWVIASHRARYMLRARRAADAVEDLEHRYRDLFDRVPVGLFRASPTGKILDVNRALLQLGGYDEKGPCLTMDFPGACADPEEFRRFLDLLMREGTVRHFEMRMRRADGVVRWAEMSARAVRAPDGAIRHYDGTLQDITARKHAEQEVREKTRLNKILLDSMPCVALLLRPRTREIVASNKAAVRAGAVPGTRCYESWGKRETPCPWCLAPEVWSGREPRHRVVETPDTVWDAHWVPVDEELYIHFAFDITERRRAEEILLEKDEQLRQAQKMEAVGRLAGGIAHDFNNFLTAINGYSDLMISRLNEADPLRFEAEEIRKAGKRAASLTRQLLAFSRRQVLQPRVLDLNAIIAGMGSLLKRLIGGHIELEIFPGEGLGSVKADPGQIEQILMNLVLNSRDAMPAGGRITLETSNLEIAEPYTRESAFVRAGSYVLLSVSDTGCGMDAAVKSRLFEPFFTTKEVGKGTGLGLATVYGIVKQSDGYIWCYSEVDRGTCFRIYLPRVEEKAETLPREQPPETRALRGTETILVVEDEDSVRNLVAEILALRGYNVLQAADGATALMVGDHHEGPLHLLLTDMVMPCMGGPEVARRISERRPGIRVLFMSGYSDTAVVRHGMLDAGAAFIEKPFGAEGLARKVREILDG
jgi:two-component system, cell cycle sensor histidine kinase and response regulator CckA